MKDEATPRRLRRVCGGLPDTTETTTFGHPTFQRKGKTFAVLDSYGGEGCICFKVIPPVQRSLVRRRAYFPAPCGARHDWTCIRLSSKVDWRRLARLITMSHDLVVKSKVWRPSRVTECGIGSVCCTAPAGRLRGRRRGRRTQPKKSSHQIQGR